MTLEEFLKRIDEIMCGTSNAERAYLEDLYDEVTKPHWISVEDELPPLGCSMIVLVSYGEDIQISEWDNGLFHEIKLGVIIHPTHWMPMPSVEHLRESTKMIEGGGEE